MPIKPFTQVPVDLRDWSRYFDDVSIVPDDLSVSTAKIANNAVTYAKIQNATNDRLLGRGDGVAGVVQEIAATGGLEFSGTSIQRSALTGDVTAPAGSNTTLIPNDTVTYAKIQNLTTARLLGRTTALAGDCEEIAVAAPLTFTALSLGVDLTAVAARSTGTYTGAFTGCTSDPAPVIRYSVSGGQVLLYLPATTATSNLVTFTVTGAPAGIRPARTQTFLCRVIDSGTVSIGIGSMDTSGTITFLLGVTAGAFANTGIKGFPLGTYGYSLD